jgi:hypothetical protein
LAAGFLDQTHRALTQLVRVLPWCSHRFVDPFNREDHPCIGAFKKPRWFTMPSLASYGSIAEVGSDRPATVGLARQLWHVPGLRAVTETDIAVRSSDLAIGRPVRGALAAVGALSWLAGGVAAFVGDNGPGAAALVIGGAAAGAVAAIGRWPSRIVAYGHEASWHEVHETVDSQIRTAEESGQPPSALRELQALRRRLDALERTGRVSRHPAEIYDDDVEEALRRLIHDVRVVRQTVRSRDVADFELVKDDRHAYIETKWRLGPTDPLRTETIERLLDVLPTGARLLVVANTPTIAEAQQKLSGRTTIVTWRDPSDDAKLGQAIADLLA